MSETARLQKGIVLSDELARDIYMHKLYIEKNSPKTSGAKTKGQSEKIARMFKVSPKTVRDIWNHITWKYATSTLWSATPFEEGGGVTTDMKVDSVSISN
jgi:hypothetical protein